VIGPDGQPVTVVVRDIPASERFYAGGDTTVRAFTRDRLGAPATIDSDGFPHGGMGMIILNGEMRFSVWRWLGAVAFLDVGNVFFRVSDIRLGQLRPALGGGLRLRWPVLPLIRLDVGYNPSPRVFQNGSREKSVAVYFGIGQAF
jgi:outer membrane translocation and assembly module TamA